MLSIERSTDVRGTHSKYKPFAGITMFPDNLSKPQFVLALARKELAMTLLSSSKDFNVAIVGGGMCGLAW